MNAVPVSSEMRKLNIEECDKWNAEEQERFLADRELRQTVAKPSPYSREEWEVQRKLYKTFVIQRLFGGEENIRQIPTIFARETNPDLWAKDLSAQHFPAAPFPITRVVYHKNEPWPTWLYTNKGISIRREDGDHLFLDQRPLDFCSVKTVRGKEGYFGKHFLDEEVYPVLCESVCGALFYSTEMRTRSLPFSPPLLRIISEYLTPFKPQPLSNTAERMRHVCEELVTSFNTHVCKSFASEKDFRGAWYAQNRSVTKLFDAGVYEKIAGITAQFLEGTTVEETSPEQLAYAIRWDDDVELPLHLTLIHPNTRDEQGMSSLHYAAHRGACHSIQQLLQMNADCNLRSNSGHTPLDLSLRLRVYEEERSPEHPHASELLVDLTRDITPHTLRRAVVNGPRRVLTQLAKRIPRLNMADEQGNTAGHWLLLDNDQAIMTRFNADQPADGSYVNHNVFIYESREPSLHSRALFLKELGVDFTAPNHAGITPLYLSAAKNSAPLLLAGIRTDLNVRDRQGNTLLIWFLFEGSPETAEQELIEELAELKRKVASYFQQNLDSLFACGRRLARFLN